MKHLVATIILLMFTSHVALGDQTNGPLVARDIYVIDGDTIRVGNTTYRLVGFDTPETWKPQCAYEKALGEAATLKLKTYLAQTATLNLVVLPGLDRYNRSLARLIISGIDVAELLIEDGLARRYNGGRRESWCKVSEHKEP